MIDLSPDLIRLFMFLASLLIIFVVVPLTDTVVSRLYFSDRLKTAQASRSPISLSQFEKLREWVSSLQEDATPSVHRRLSDGYAVFALVGGKLKIAHENNRSYRDYYYAPKIFSTSIFSVIVLRLLQCTGALLVAAPLFLIIIHDDIFLAADYILFFVLTVLGIILIRFKPLIHTFIKDSFQRTEGLLPSIPPKTLILLVKFETVIAIYRDDFATHAVLRESEEFQVVPTTWGNGFRIYERLSPTYRKSLTVRVTGLTPEAAEAVREELAEIIWARDDFIRFG